MGVLDEFQSVVSEDTSLTLAVAMLVFGLLVSYLVWRGTYALFRLTGLDDTVEGTTFERAAGRFGTSTVGIVAALFALSVYVIAALTAFNIARVLDIEAFWFRVATLLPQLLLAIFALIVGFILGDKAELFVQERLRSIKLPEAGLIPALVKYSILYIAALVALGQVGIVTTALVVLLAAYAFGVIVFATVAFKSLLSAGAAGVYLLLTEPYSIGDEVQIDGKRGIVQEMTMFVTHVEADGEEYIIPNQRVFQSGIVRVRD